MKNFSARFKLNLRVTLIVLAVVELLLLGWIIFSPSSSVVKEPPATASPSGGSSSLSASKSPTPTLPPLSAPLNPQHGIHGPVGGQWTDALREALSSFQNSAGERAAPGLVVALSTDMAAANNREGMRMEQDLLRYQQQGSEVYIRIYPQRFPGGLTETLGPKDGRNTLSGTPEDAAQDIFRFLQEQQQRNGWHFTRIIPGNEPNLEWPNENYYQNVLAWRSNNDPIKYDAINSYLMKLYKAWQRRLEQPDAVIFRDTVLYFPALAQDGDPTYFGGAYFYDKNQPIANKYDRLRSAIELFGRFSWHNYFRPGQAWNDRAATAFPDWLKQGLAKGWPYLISEAGWTPDALALPIQKDGLLFIVRFWNRLKWSAALAQDSRRLWRTQDETLAGFNFEDDLQYFITTCAGDTGDTNFRFKPGVAVWLAGSEGNFIEAVGVEPEPEGAIRRWLRRYAAWQK
ncbi:MAG: hypothetical protein HXX20_06095 [Chloroflexi bacterium]|nr:hypothetical protein [Chloroflexota bacterium]